MKKSIKALFTVCIMALCLTFLLTGCNLFVKDCEHTYDNACDTACNLCGEARETAHDFTSADCDTPKTCSKCGVTDGEALGHTPADDDGDCSTSVICTVCEEILVEAKEHDLAGDYEYDEDGHWQICQNDGCEVKGDREDHNGGKATSTELAICEVCSQPYGELAIPRITGVVIKNTDSPQYNAETRTFTVKANGTGDLPILEANGRNFDEFSNYSF